MQDYTDCDNNLDDSFEDPNVEYRGDEEYESDNDDDDEIIESSQQHTRKARKRKRKSPKIDKRKPEEIEKKGEPEAHGRKALSHTDVPAGHRIAKEQSDSDIEIEDGLFDDDNELLNEGEGSGYGQSVLTESSSLDSVEQRLFSNAMQEDGGESGNGIEYLQDTENSSDRKDSSSDDDDEEIRNNDEKHEEVGNSDDDEEEATEDMSEKQKVMKSIKNAQKFVDNLPAEVQEDVVDLINDVKNSIHSYTKKCENDIEKEKTKRRKQGNV